MTNSFDFGSLVELCRQTHEAMRTSAGRVVDNHLAVRNWLFGWYIVEYEQSGADRARYGSATLKQLAAVLKQRIGRGFSVDSLELMRRFFLTYRTLPPPPGISETPPRISPCPKSEALSRILPEDRPLPPALPPMPIVADMLAGSEREIRQALSAALCKQFNLGWSH